MKEDKIEVPPETSKFFDLNYVTDEVFDTLVQLWDKFLSHIPYLVGGLVVLFLTWIIAKIARDLGHRIFKSSKLRRSFQELVLRMLSIAIWILGILFAAMIIFPGLTPAKALGGLGLVSVAVGLAFRDIFENFFAGILLLWRYPFETGDFIECEDIVGRIEKIEVRMTKIRLTSDELVVVPNSFLFKNPVSVLTNKQYRRVRIIVGIAYSEKLDESTNIIKEAVNQCSTVDKGNPVQVFPFSFSSSSVDIEVCWWTGSTPLEIRASRSEVLHAIKSTLDHYGIEIPYPYRTLTFAEPLNIQVDNQSNDKSKPDE